MRRFKKKKRDYIQVISSMSRSLSDLSIPVNAASTFPGSTSSIDDVLLQRVFNVLDQFSENPEYGLCFHKGIFNDDLFPAF